MHTLNKEESSNEILVQTVICHGNKKIFSSGCHLSIKNYLLKLQILKESREQDTRDENIQQENVAEIEIEVTAME